MFLYSFILYSDALCSSVWTEFDHLYVRHVLIMDSKPAWTLNIQNAACVDISLRMNEMYCVLAVLRAAMHSSVSRCSCSPATKDGSNYGIDWVRLQRDLSDDTVRQEICLCSVDDIFSVATAPPHGAAQNLIILPPTVTLEKWPWLFGCTSLSWQAGRRPAERQTLNMCQRTTADCGPLALVRDAASFRNEFSIRHV